MRRSLTATAVATASVLALPLLATPAAAHGGDPLDKVVFKQVLKPETTGGISKNMDFVANAPYQVTGGTRGMGGTDIEFARIGGNDYAFLGTYQNGMQIADITNPAEPEVVSVYDCQILQGDVQVFRQGLRVLAAYTADSSFGAKGANSECGQDLGIASGKLGTVLVDVTNPLEPKSVSFIEVPQGSHNMTVHPSGKYLYNSNSDLITSTTPNIAIIDISTPEAPKTLQNFRIPFVPTSLGSESHDITFNEDGTRAYSAALSQTLILDTTKPEAPTVVSQIVDPTVQVSHGSDPITLTNKAGKERTFLLVSDEQLGAAAGTNCPGGGVHIYEITGTLEKAPKKVGTWFIGETKPSTATCTAHVFRMHSEQGLFTIAWYDQGVRVVDVQGLAEQDLPVPFVASGDAFGIREIGRYTFNDHNTWSFKTNKIEADGSFYGYGNDLGRGLDVYRFDG
ncbi:MAG TPA: hypothetical protein VNU66_11120, partial [Mycobacteriales bacterium]|nr:hypothetical protein [Mycobacteriales bacterium]